MHQILNENFITSPAFKYNNYKVSDFEMKTIERARYWKSLHAKNHILNHGTQEKRHVLQIFCFFEKQDFETKNSKTVWFFELKNSRSLHFDVENYQRVKFWIQKISSVMFRKKNLQPAIIRSIKLITCQKFNWKIFIFSKINF